MNTIEQRAQRAMKRVNALGFTKGGAGGKPMTIDQARELIAAEEGFRNWHVLHAQQGATTSQAPAKGGGHQVAEQLADKPIGLAWVDRLIEDYGQDGIHGVGLGGALQAMRKHWADHFAEGHAPRILMDDLESLIDHLRDVRVTLSHWVHDEQMREEGSTDSYVLLHDEPDGWAVYTQGGNFFLREDGADGARWFRRVLIDQPLLNVANERFFVHVEGRERVAPVDRAAFEFFAGLVKCTLLSHEEFMATQMELRYGLEHPIHDREAWSWEVQQGDTRLGYWAWVVHELIARLDEDSEESSLSGEQAFAPFVTGEWGHLFGPGSSETIVRFVADIEKEEIVALQAQTSRGWVACNAREIADVADSLFNANEEVLLQPKEHGLDRCIDLPDWACS